MENITAQTALDRLDGITTEAEFRTLIDDLSIDVDGKNSYAKTILYSGKTLVDGNYVDISTTLENSLNDPNIRLIDNTQADKFLSSIYKKESHPDFEMGQMLKDKLEEIFGGNPLNEGTLSNAYLNNADGGAWDSVSQIHPRG